MSAIRERLEIGTLNSKRLFFFLNSRFSRGDYSKQADLEVQAIQGIIRHGLEREEIRDEIYVQCVRQINGNPSPEQVDRLWLLLCLVVVAFTPSKSFFKVRSNCCCLKN